MDLLTEPVLKQPRRAADTHSAIEWLDALSSGSCDRDAFVRGVNDILLRSPDAGWELLALLDQYFRRGRISAEVFRYFKAHLQRALMSKSRAADVSMPMSSSPVPPAAPTERTLVAGDLLRDRYRLVGLLGRGGMGAVFEAIDEYRLDRANGEQKVAIKVLHSAVIQRPRLFAELRREFQHLQSLSHPNIVRVHEFDRDGDTAFFTMEYLSGDLLSRVLAGRASAPLFRPYALGIIRDVGAALAHAHARGVVHGDLNPGNIFITDNGEVRVLDFGASHQFRRTPWISEFDNEEQTAVATPSYASCEVLEGETADVRDDIYALGAIMYLLLTGRHPFDDQSALKARTLRLNPRRPGGLSGRQWHALRAALEFKRDSRPADMQTWLKRLDLRAAIPALPVLPKLQTVDRDGGIRAPRLAMAGLFILLAAGGAWWANTHGESFQAAAAEAASWRSTLWHALTRADGSQRAGSRQIPTTVPADATPTAAADTADASPAASTSLPLSTRSTQATPTAPATSADEALTTGQATYARQAPPPRQAPTASEIPSTGSTAPRDAMATNPTGSASTAQSASTVTQLAARGAADASIPAATASLKGGAANDSGVPPPGRRARIELTADNVDVTRDETVARVDVRRSRWMRGDATFSWWTESGTAKPGRDFIPVTAHTQTLGSGKSTGTLFIPLLADATRRDPRSFYVVIDAAGDDAAVGPRTLTQITLAGSD